MNFNNIKIVPKIKELKIDLFKHQLASIYKMEKLEINNLIETKDYIKETKIGVHSDIGGFGKTLSIIGLIVRDKMEWDIDIPFISNKLIIESKGRIKTYINTKFDKLPTTLILVSPSIISQWEKELSYTKLKFIKILKIKDIQEIKAEEYDVILVIPNMYNKLIVKYCDYAWKRFIFDEPGHIKVPSMKEIYANFYWFITATPNLIAKCKSGFMKEFFENDWVDFETKYKDIIIRNDIDFIMSSFTMPEIIHKYYNCYQPLYNIVTDFVTPEIKTMVEAGNIEGAINLLGGKKTTNIIELIKKRKEYEITKIENKIILKTEDTNKINTLKKEIHELDEKFKNILKSICCICYEKLSSPILEINCNNLFCGKCIFKWLEDNQSCPLCRNNIKKEDLVYYKQDSKEDNKDFLSKSEIIKSIINDNKKGKFLIFSQYNTTFESISDSLKENNFNFFELKGNANLRENKLESFKKGDINIIFLNSIENGAGINLQEATDIILYHKMEKNLETQIINRGYRIGRKIPLNIHHLEVME